MQRLEVLSAAYEANQIELGSAPAAPAAPAAALGTTQQLLIGFLCTIRSIGLRRTCPTRSLSNLPVPCADK